MNMDHGNWCLKCIPALKIQPKIYRYSSPAFYSKLGLQELHNNYCLSVHTQIELMIHFNMWVSWLSGLDA